MGCPCASYTAPLKDLKEVRSRAQATDELLRQLVPLANHPPSWRALYRCPDCGTHWQSSFFESYRMGSGDQIFYQVPPIDPSEWLRHPFPDAVTNAELNSFFNSLPPETGPEKCRVPECDHQRISQSVFCRLHHLDQLQNADIKPAWSR
jgi:hypothetical protein